MAVAKKTYQKPSVRVHLIDKSISLVMMTVSNPDPRGGTKGTPSPDPFASPFSDKTFG